MKLFAGLRSRRLARRAAAAFARDGFEASAAVLDAADGLGGAAWAHFAVALYNQDRKPESERAIRRSLQVEPGRGDALVFLAELLAETGRTAEAIETYRALLRRFPQAASQALDLAKLLAAEGDFAAVRDVLKPFGERSQEILMTLAQAHYELDEHEAVVALLAPAIEQLRLDLKAGILGSTAHRDLYADYQDVSRLHDDSYAALHGREKVIESALARGDLDPHAPVNYRLLGEARMAHAPSWAPDTRLRSVDETIAFATALTDAGERSRGLCHLASARLRQGKLAEARKLFDDARDEDDDNFAAYLGLAAAMELEGTRALRRLAELPDRAPPADVERVVTDWGALTAQERKVVSLVLSPVAGALPHVLAAGATVRILPVDARLTDLSEMAAATGDRADDHRCLEAITGAATAQVCASKIEELLCLASDRDSVFAHELAHLIHFHLPEPLQEKIDDLYERALDHEHVATDYQTTDPAEFFAVAYTDFLAHAYGLPSARDLDDEGIVEETFALIRTLSATAAET